MQTPSENEYWFLAGDTNHSGPGSQTWSTSVGTNTVDNPFARMGSLIRSSEKQGAYYRGIFLSDELMMLMSQDMVGDLQAGRVDASALQSWISNAGRFGQPLPQPNDEGAIRYLAKTAREMIHERDS